MAIETGLEILLRERPESVRGLNVGLVTNYACVTANFEYTIDLLLGAGVRHLTVFAPEHGFWSDVQYMDEINKEGWRSGAPVTVVKSYDGANPTLFSPDPRFVSPLDVLLVDVQDVGARCYTYVATMIKAMGIAAEVGVPVIVTDRPNPIDGVHIEGSLGYKEPYISYVMHSPVPMRHGMTAAELARFANDVLQLGCELDVVPMRGWHRSMSWNDTGLPWVSPSPNIATYDSALVYPGTVFLEGTNLSEGRGTTHPFELAGAPWLDAFEFAERLEALELPGVRFRPQLFTPTFSKHSGRASAHEWPNDVKGQCGGVFIHVTDPHALRPVRMGLLLIKVARDMAPDRFDWRRSVYEFAHCMAIDTLVGTSRYQMLVDTADLNAVQEWLETWEADEAKFAATREPYLIRDYADRDAQVVRIG